MDGRAGLARIDPHLLGPLGDQPAYQTAPVELFPGEERYLPDKARRARVALRARIAEMVGRVLEDGEQVLYLAQGAEVPPFLHQAGLGVYVYRFHRVALVFTDRRLVEVLLDLGGKAPATRIRAFGWAAVKDLSVGMRGLALTTAGDRPRKYRWRITLKGDRKLLELLVPRIRERLLGHAAAPQSAAAAVVPVWHCPACGSALARSPERCASCGTLFRSPRLAAWLALAIPGGGLFYAGHPVLGTLDLAGEVILYGVLALVLGLSTSAAGVVELLTAGGAAKLLLAALFTKVESAHLAHMLTARTKPDTEAGRRLWKRWAVGGGVLSLVALLGLAGAPGRLANVVDHDLRFTAAGWAGSWTPAEWQFFEDDGDTRSEWVHEDGSALAVMAFPLGLTESFADLRRAFDRELAEGGHPPAEPISIGPFEGFRATFRLALADGRPFVGIRYLIYDRAGKDYHMIVWNVLPEEAAAAEERLQALLKSARWVDAVPGET